MTKQTKQALAVLLSAAMLFLPMYSCLLGIGAKASAASQTVTFPAAQDTFVSNFNGQGDRLGTSLNSNKLIYGKFRHVYLQFDLSAIDTARYNVDEMEMTLNFRKSHAPNELIFTESQSVLRDSDEAWTVTNLTYNNRPYDIAESPVITRNVTGTGEENLSIDLSPLVRSALSNGRKTVSIHLATAKVNEDSVSASEMYSSRNTSGQPGPSLTVTLGKPIVEDNIDRTALQALIAEANQLVENYYTPGSWADLAQALSHAKEISLIGTSQAEVDGALVSLQAAMDGLEAAELPAKIAGPDMGNYFVNSQNAAKIFRMKNENGQYVRVDPGTEKLSLTSDAASASAFALYVLDYFATVDHAEPEDGATLTAYSIKSLDNGKFLTIQNYFTAEEFLGGTHRYYNILSGAQSGTSTSRIFEIKASAAVPGWNERFYIDHYADSGYYRIWSHLSTMRDDANFSRFNVKMTDSSMQSSGTGAENTEYRFYFEEASGRDLLEVNQEVSGDTARLAWRPVNGDVSPAHYRINGTVAEAVYADGLMRAALTGLSPGVHSYSLAYSGGDYQVQTELTIRIFDHPGILLGSGDLDRMKQHVQNKEEPWYSDYQRLLNSVPYLVAGSDYETTVFSNVGRGGGASDSGNIGYFEKAGNAAYFNALQWVITGEDRFAAKAADILTKWAQGLKVIDGRDRILGAGINAYKYASAAEIIRYYNGGYSGYSDADFKTLQSMMLNVVYPVIQDAAVPMIANGNWDLAAIVSMMSIGVLCDNTEIFDRAAFFYQDIHTNGSIFAYVHDSGQTMETGRDQAHAMLALGYMSEICLIAKNQNVDLYSLYGNRLAKAFEYLAKYNLYSKELYGVDVPFTAMPNVFNDTGKGYYGAGFDRDSNGLNRGELRPVFEQGLALYAGTDADLTWTARAAAAARPQGMVHFDNLNFGTLAHYNGEPQESDGPYFQLRTRWEPLYQRNWSMVDGERVAETLNSYYDITAGGELVTSVMKQEAPFYQLVANDDGTYSVRLVKTNTYLSVKDELAGNYNVIKADAAEIGDHEKFLLRSTGVGPFFLASPLYGNRIVYQDAAGSGSSAVLTLRLGTKTLADIADVGNVTTNERLLFMYNTEDVALYGSAAPSITSANSGSVASGRGGTFQVQAAGTAPFTYSLEGAPAEVAINRATGLITVAGTLAPGVYTFTVTASNGIAPHAEQQYTLTVTAVTEPPASSEDDTAIETGPSAPAVQPTETPSGKASLNGVTGALVRNEAGGYSLVSTAEQIAAALAGSSQLIINAEELDDLTIQLPLSAMDSAALTVRTDFGAITLPNETLQNIMKKYGDTLTLRIRQKEGYTVELLKEDQPAPYHDPANPLTLTLPVRDAAGYNGDEWVAIRRENGKIFPLAVAKGGSMTFAIEATGAYDVIHNGRSFDDVGSSHWAAADIALAAARGLFSGTGDQTFEPDGTLTRAMLAQVLANLEGADLSGYGQSAFTDVPEGEWYAAAAAWANRMGIVNGMEEGRFAPQASLTREQLAVMLHRYAAAKGYKLPASAAAAFTDGGSISSWAAEAVDALAAAGLITRKSDGRFDPQAGVTRAEAAAVFARFIRALSPGQ